jgi:hypothetical protein
MNSPRSTNPYPEQVTKLGFPYQLPEMKSETRSLQTEMWRHQLQTMKLESEYPKKGRATSQDWKFLQNGGTQGLLNERFQNL